LGRAIGGVLLAWTLAAVLTGRSVLLAGGDVLADCIDTVGRMAAGGHGIVLQIALLTLATLAVVSVGLLISRLAMALGAGPDAYAPALPDRTAGR
jgi:hypothetical protein